MKLNPSQTNGNRPPAVPPSQSAQNGQAPWDGSHASREVRAKLGDLTPELAAGVRRVADAD
jgi:hypothetical protein